MMGEALAASRYVSASPSQRRRAARYVTPA